MKVRDFLAMAALGLAAAMPSAGPATAQEAQEALVCPDNAADMMLQVASETPQVKDQARLQTAFTYATHLPAACPEDPYVQYFAANTLLAISDLLPEPNAKFERFREAITAFLAYDAHADHENDVYVSGLVDANGAPVTVNVGDTSFDFLAEYAAPKVVWFEGNVLFHDWVTSRGRSTEENPTCPYVRQKFAAAEAYGHYLGHSQTAPIILENGGYPNPLGSTRRMEYLALACPDARTDVTYQLGNVRVMFAEFIDARGSETGNGYIDSALETIEAYSNLAAGTPEVETTRYTIAQRWKSEMLALKAASED